MNKPTHDDLIDAIYACILYPDGWERTLTRIRQYLGASAINVMSLEVATHVNPCLYISNLPQDQGHLYRDYWLSRDPWLTALERKGLGAGGATYYGDMLMERKELIKTPFYNEWLAGLEIKDVLGANLWGHGPQRGHDPEHPRIVFGVYRDRAGDTFSEIDRQKLEGFSPHLNHAVQIAVRMGMLVRNNHLGESVLSALRHATITLDDNARILAANPAGARLLDHRPERLRVRHGRLAGFVGELSPSLEAALALGREGRACVLVWRTDGGAHLSEVLTARLAPLREDANLALPGQHAAFLLIVDASAQIDDGVFQSFCDLFRFSHAERRVLRQYMHGPMRAEDVAKSLNIALPTVRTHLQKIREKAGGAQMSELVAMARIAMRAV